MSRKRVLVTVLVLIGLPAVFAFGEAAAFYLRNHNNGSIISSGQKREHLLYVPPSYDPRKPAPLVISMHGAGGWPAQQMEVSNWNRLADTNGFIVVYPSGAEGAGPRIWHVDRGAELMRDVTYISKLIDELGKSYNIDRQRIYADGLSNGGGMAFVLSCTLADRIAAVGMVAAAQTLPWNWCAGRPPVPMIAFHGTADPVVPYNGGRSWLSAGSFPNVPIWAARWARRNECAAKPIDSAVAPDVSRREYRDCADDASVVLYTIRGGGHTWPGGHALPEWFVGPTCQTVDATREIWTFFRAHPHA